ncbi:MAG: diaminopimelate epimerase [Deltaproteobacteria bacterium]|nr:diaminopimelate epimerase [Deltaproteobacteria bacterium]
MPFTKMQGLGNDFVFLNGLKLRLPNPRKTARDLCDRRYGIGADQMLILTKSRKADFRMQIFNADGSESGMCGNGLRCLVRFVIDHKLSSKKELTIETGVGLQKAKVVGKNRILVDMGEPILKGKLIPVNLSGRVINRPIKIDSKEFRMTCVSMGNPHAVIFIDELASFPVEKYGPLLERHSLFPQRANIEFVKVLNHNAIELRVWERGAGETLACGSGACASAVASVLNGFTERKVDVHLKGGTLEIEWDRTTNHVKMIGPAESVFDGEVEI